MAPPWAIGRAQYVPTGGYVAQNALCGRVGPRRHRKFLRDNIRGITNGAIRRLARRGGVRRISAMIYDDVRSVIKIRLREILEKVVVIVEHPRSGEVTNAGDGRKIVRVDDVIYALRLVTCKKSQFLGYG